MTKPSSSTNSKVKQLDASVLSEATKDEASEDYAKPQTQPLELGQDEQLGPSKAEVVAEKQAEEVKTERPVQIPETDEARKIGAGRLRSYWQAREAERKGSRGESLKATARVERA